MGGAKSLQRQNMLLHVKALEERFKGRQVRAVNAAGKTVEGIVSHVNMNGNHIDYFLAGVIGPHRAPTLMESAA